MRGRFRNEVCPGTARSVTAERFHSANQPYTPRISRDDQMELFCREAAAHSAKWPKKAVRNAVG